MNVRKSLIGHIAEESTLHRIPDNVDGNVCTLNCDNTRRGMGIIAAITKGKFPQTDVQHKFILHCYEEINTENIFKIENIKMSSIMILSNFYDNISGFLKTYCQVGQVLCNFSIVISHLNMQVKYS